MFFPLVSNAVFAATSCDIEVFGGMKLNATSLEFFQAVTDEQTEQKSLYQISSATDSKKLLINKQEVSLTAPQQRLINDYDNNIRQIVPKVKTVANDSLDLAIDGIDVAFNDLLGEGNQLTKNLTEELSLLQSQLAASLSIEKGIAVGIKGESEDNLFGNDIEQRVKSAIQKAVLDSMGSIFITLGQQLMFSGNSDVSLDTQMKHFTDKVEQEISAKTALIEEKSQVLCQNIIKIDALEEKLKQQFPSLSTVNTFTVTQRRD